MHTATIRAADLPLVLAAAKLRRWNKGGTPQLAAISAGPRVQVDCRSSNSWDRPAMIDAARKSGLSPARVVVQERGYIARIFERVNRAHGRAEVLRTWGVGIRALRLEPRYVFNGGRAAA